MLKLNNNSDTKIMIYIIVHRVYCIFSVTIGVYCIMSLVSLSVSIVLCLWFNYRYLLYDVFSVTIRVNGIVSLV